MKGGASNLSQTEMDQIRRNLEGTPDIEEAAQLMSLAGNSTRLKLLYLLNNMKELCVVDLAEMLGVSVSAVSQHLAKLKAYGLVAPRRDAQTVYYRLADHSFNAKLRQDFGPIEYCFPAWTRVAIIGGADRPISDLRPGDLVRSWDTRRGGLARGRVARVIFGTAARLIRLNGDLVASPAHRLLTGRGYIPFDAIETGDQLVRSPGSEAQEVRQIDVFEEKTVVYNLDVSPYASFFAQGLVVEDYTGEEMSEGGVIASTTTDPSLAHDSTALMSRKKSRR